MGNMIDHAAFPGPVNDDERQRHYDYLDDIYSLGQRLIRNKLGFESIVNDICFDSQFERRFLDALFKVVNSQEKKAAVGELEQVFDEMAETYAKRHIDAMARDHKLGQL